MNTSANTNVNPGVAVGAGDGTSTTVVTGSPWQHEGMTYVLNRNSGMSRHKAEVPPVFIAYRRVSSEGSRISLMWIATAILKSVAHPTSLDAVQPMKQGWYVYMKTNADRAHLVETGVTIAGKYISLQSDYHPEVH